MIRNFFKLDWVTMQHYISLKNDMKKDCPASPLTITYDKKCTILILTKILRFKIYQKTLRFCDHFKFRVLLRRNMLLKFFFGFWMFCSFCLSKEMFIHTAGVNEHSLRNLPFSCLGKSSKISKVSKIRTENRNIVIS